MAVALLLAGAAERHAVQHRDVVADHRRLADDDAVRMVDHDPPPDPGVGVNVDAEHLGAAHLQEQRQVAAPAGPEVVRHAVGLERQEALEVEERLEHPVAGRVAVVDRDDVRPRRRAHRPLRRIGVLRHLAQQQRRHFRRGELLRDPVAQRPLERLVVQHDGVGDAGHERLGTRERLGLLAHLVPDGVDRLQIARLVVGLGLRFGCHRYLPIRPCAIGRNHLGWR